MTETTPDFDVHLAAMKAGRDAAKQLFRTNKDRLMTCLARGGVATVTVEFDGCGDSGQIEASDAFDAVNAGVKLPNDTVAIIEASWDGSSSTTEEIPTQEAVERIAYMLLTQTHDGWENNEGAYGTFLIDVGARSIVLEYNERYVETHYYEHEL